MCLIRDVQVFAKGRLQARNHCAGTKDERISRQSSHNNPWTDDKEPDERQQHDRDANDGRHGTLAATQGIPLGTGGLGKTLSTGKQGGNVIVSTCRSR